ncbi:hypothetical protein ACFT9I_26945 [Streptomyces sp. NPDC057137]|uniref:hypothetical protein n=1 Tax=Streptomyces sp. NPDC057137 TaxID=3346030 RepID=UPI003635EBE7
MAGASGDSTDSGNGADAAPERWSPAARALRAAGLLACVLAIVAVAPAVGRVWYGDPYPTADPEGVAERIQDRSQRAYDLLGLPEPVVVARNSLDSSVCRDRGLLNLTGDPEPGVIAPQHRWGVDGVAEDVARAALSRLRERLTARGWELTHEWDRRGTGRAESGFRFEDTVSGDKVDARWNSSRGALFVDVYAPCARVPDGRVEASRDLFLRTPNGPFPDGTPTGLEGRVEG